MIDDNTIDDINAKYYCLFMDKKVIELIDQAMSYDAEDGKKLAEIAKKIQDSKHFKEDEKVDEGAFDSAQVMHQAAFPLATGNPFQPNFRGMDPSSGELSLQAQQKNSVIAGATAAALVGASAVPGGWAALGAALGSVGSWLATAAATVGYGGIMAIVGGIVTVSTYLYPRIAKMMHEFGRSGDIARCKFEADGQDMVLTFSLSERRWELQYADGRWLSSRTSVPQADVKAFFQTQFFQKFLAQCRKHLLKVYDSPERMRCLKTLADMSDKSSKKVLMKVIDGENAIRSYMLTGKYKTA